MKYILTSPSWELTSTDIDIVLNMFEGWICVACKKEISHCIFPVNYEDLEPKEKISELQNTWCGAEFIFEVQQDT